MPDSIDKQLTRLENELVAQLEGQVPMRKSQFKLHLKDYAKSYTRLFAQAMTAAVPEKNKITQLSGDSRFDASVINSIVGYNEAIDVTTTAQAKVVKEWGLE